MKRALVVIGIVILVVVVAVAGVFGYKKWQSNKKAKQQFQIAQSNPTQSQEKQPETVKRAGAYVAYDPALFSQASDGKVVLFFNAKWCGTCKQLDKDLKATKLPDNLTIMNVDYDKNAVLRKKYSVPFEDTFVQVDAAGVMLNRWSGSEDVAEVIALTK